MDVFLVPTGENEYELYTEEPDEIPAPPPEVPGGFFRFFTPRGIVGLFLRLKFRFTDMLAEAERDRRRGHAERSEEGGWASRLTRKVMRKVAESIAEQRLLWNLRGADDACFFYPSDVDEEVAVGELRRQLNRDFEKHRFWLAIDSLLLVASGALVLLPGPNILGYYFAFRVVGHFFSVRGAKRGLGGVTWTNKPSDPLANLRGLGALDPMERLEHVERVASALSLDHLPSFFQRVYSQR
jgi:hypothetical protein